MVAVCRLPRALAAARPAAAVVAVGASARVRPFGVEIAGACGGEGTGRRHWIGCSLGIVVVVSCC